MSTSSELEYVTRSLQMAKFLWYVLSGLCLLSLRWRLILRGREVFLSRFIRLILEYVYVTAHKVTIGCFSVSNARFEGLLANYAIQALLVRKLIT